MRADALGFFWEDRPVVRIAKPPPPKRTPPEPFWLRDDYLPGLAEALQPPVHHMSDDELFQAMLNREELIFDSEVYPNYFCLCFMSSQTGHVYVFETTGALTDTQSAKVCWILENFLCIGFNSLKFDLTIIAIAMAGHTTEQLYDAAQMLIVEELQPYIVRRRYKVKELRNLNHIDLIEVAPLFASLKIYGGRLHTPKMQNLPFPPGTVLTSEKMAITRWYCINDLHNTAYLREALRDQINLRYTISQETGIDLRSKSDAQIAEAVIGAELKRLTGEQSLKPPDIIPGTVYKYRAPNFIKFQSETMKWALDLVERIDFVVTDEGNIGLPPELKECKIPLGHSTYTLRIGGLHSCEKKAVHIAGNGWNLFDRDVSSFYPYLIINQGLYPRQLGPTFLQVYQAIVERRIAAKRAKDKVTAEALKITINGAYGKLGSQFSIFYAPDLLIQTTITGQLVLLMLIERLEMAGIAVVSANTDGIVIKCHDSQIDTYNAIIKQWEHETKFETEETRYLKYYARDVNNYIAFKEDGTTKGKGAFFNPWHNPTNDTKIAIFRLHKNPTASICVEAAEALISKGVPMDVTIRNCQDIRKFVRVYTVNGEAVKINSAENPLENEYLGKAVRWYYGTGETKELVSAKTGNKVSLSDGAIPVQILPASLPDNIDYDRYVKDTEKVLRQLGYYE